MKPLVFTDLHIEEKWLEECEQVCKEICSYSGDLLICAGDLLHKEKPTTKEIIFATKWMSKFKNKFGKVVLVRGNHDNTEEVSNVDYLKYLGIEIVDDYVYNDGNYSCYIGHFFTTGSVDFKTKTVDISQLSKYTNVILGHHHNFKLLKGTNKNPKIIHLGSSRFCKFDEAEQNNKFIADICDKTIKLIPLKSPIPMVNVSIKDIDKLNPNTKVRLIITSQEEWKRAINKINKWEEKFIEFRYKLDFILDKNDNKKTSSTIKNSSTLKESIDDFFKTIEDKEEKELLENQFEKEGLL